MKQLIVTFDQSWVLAQRNAGQLPGNAVAKVLEKLGLKASVSGFTRVSAVFSEDAITDIALFDAVREALMQEYSLSVQELDKVVALHLAAVEEPAPSVATEAKPSEAASAENPATATAMDAISRLLGAEELIGLCRKIHDMAPLLRRQNLTRIITNRSLLFAVDEGYGLTTSLTLLSELFKQLQLFDLKNDPLELKLEAPNSRNEPLADMLKTLERVQNRMVCIDIRNWMDKAATPEFRDFLSRLQKRTDKLIYVFRVPYMEKEAIHRVEAAIADVMLLDTVAFPPLSHAKLQIIADETLRDYGFTATEEAWDLFRQRLAEEQSDGRFYGTKTAKKVVDEMILLKCQTILETGEENTVIEEADLEGMVRTDTQISAHERLARMVGVDLIRQRLEEIIGQIEFARQNKGVSAPAMHMRFVGNPGTGKTTIARIVGQMLKERKILSRGYFFEHTGGDFIGMYVGHTAPKTLALCRDAYGSVLFIDEAYTLADASYSDGGGYAKEAIDTLIAQMENHREDLVVIMAGYPREMARLMDMNPGLAGRMPYELVFPNYTTEELAEIFLRMADGNGFICDEGVEDAVRKYFAELPRNVLEDKNFANARFARNLFERTWSKTVMRAQLDGSDPKIIVLADFRNAAGEDVKALGAKQGKQARPGYRLGLI